MLVSIFKTPFRNGGKAKRNNPPGEGYNIEKYPQGEGYNIEKYPQGEGYNIEK